jgi:ankyrin repeat protein
MVAAKHGHVAVVELLLLAGADYFLRNKVGTSYSCHSWCWLTR